MGNDTIVNLMTYIRNADMVKKKTIRVAATIITENITRILLREGFIEDVRKHREDTRGQAVSWYSAGACGFKGTKRRSPFAAQTAAANVVDTLVNQGLLKEAEVMISGPGPGRDTALRAIAQSGIQLSYVRDVTPMLHNGCRPPKRRRV
ncbi:small ribosomal subunit protein uS11c [Cryptomeria japonica]|uniref:small ribosomal subunit protein uS11c n=1 Tax=Cryptomeria japonica TaxID=3369 RepID=UPI0027DA3420|nr:small ribosomal subunit protein uS11c [Cryptomeria japonica]